MLGKQVILYLKNGTIEPVVCLEFKIGIEDNAPAIMFRIADQRMYVVKLDKIDRYDINHVWIFDDELPPNILPFA